jgi:hypothetical protein
MKIISKLLFVIMFFLIIPNVDAYSLGDELNNLGDELNTLGDGIADGFSDMIED